jgi:hypothetical protein
MIFHARTGSLLFMAMQKTFQIVGSLTQNRSFITLEKIVKMSYIPCRSQQKGKGEGQGGCPSALCGFIVFSFFPPKFRVLPCLRTLKSTIFGLQ